MPILKHLQTLLKGKLQSNDNLHWVAISNLQDEEYKLERWWRKKYKQPPKPLDDYTTEELFIEFLEDFYEKNPEKITEFMQAAECPPEEEKWTVPDHVEELLAKRRTKSKVGGKIAKYFNPNDRNLSDEECQMIFDRIGKAKSKSKEIKIADDEFEEVFGEE